MVQPIAPRLQTCRACYCTETVRNFNTIVSTLILHYNVVILRDHRRPKSHYVYKNTCCLKAWVCSPMIAGIVGSNPARGMDACLL